MSPSLSVIPPTEPRRRHSHHNSSNNNNSMDRMDAARALLGVSPASSNISGSSSRSSFSPNNTSRSRLSSSRVSFNPTISFSPSTISTCANNKVKTIAVVPPEAPSLFSARFLQRNSNSNNVSFAQYQLQLQPAVTTTFPVNALDALAALASCEHEQPTTSSSTTASSSDCSSDYNEGDDDFDAMPPPAPRLTSGASRVGGGGGGRRRSVSNPEGMEKWAPPLPGMRRHFVLPASILEEELAEASAAMEAHQQLQQQQHQNNSSYSSHYDEEDEDSFAPRLLLPKITTITTTTRAPISGLMSEEEQANLTPDELLKRARSRLLEDLSEGSLSGEKGVLTLPHSLNKYKEVYNKNGRIGIYTPAERSAIIARFQSKRSRRVWNKKIRYNCRKNLADRRMRVKGRFVKRGTEQQAATATATTILKSSSKLVVVDETGVTTPEEEPLLVDQDRAADEDMPDVNDPEAGFCPTDDQPYRRTRRHTIT